MRHGPAEDDAPSGRDFDRRLSVRGRERTERVARALARRADVPALVWCSPLVRTVETAQLVSKVLGLAIVPELRDDLQPGGDAFRVWRSPDDWAQRPGPVLLVGHEPDLSLLTTHLCPSWSGRYEKATVVGLDIIWRKSGAQVSGQVVFTIDAKHPDN